ncbi:MAG: branched-chain amino acid aminotransferase [Deltaproteobacteria bacterium]|nr:branched-chain amino acid aminotransferase [Deltaproteobacteria bacterium]MBN2671929.1 branched-chain amino acid aminotransferase [Deltaproteobacteria bacterium]
MQRADLDWKNLGFTYRKTDFNIRYTWKDGVWNDGVVSSDEIIPMHMAATCLHYGQQAFEGLKAYEQQNGDVVVFRDNENALRMNRSCDKIYMPTIPVEMFQDAVNRVIDANKKYIPPFGTGATLYIRPLVIGTGARIGVRPADEYMFIVMVTPVGPYFKEGFKPVDLVVEESFDRAAPNGVGDVKVGGNYAAGLRGSFKAKAQGYTEALYLDAREKKYLDESGPANFFGITKDKQYVTPQSNSVLPSITNMSLIQLADDMGLNPVRRAVPVEEIFEFIDAGCCGTAAVITPVSSIAYRDRKAVYSTDGQPGEYCTRLYNQLVNIQLGIEPDKHGWIRKIPL